MTASGHIIVMVVTVGGMCFTWPTLEALVSEGEDTRRPAAHGRDLQHRSGPAPARVAYFSGGAMLEKFGLNSLFYVPVAILIVLNSALTFWLESQARQADRGADVLVNRPLLVGRGTEPASTSPSAERAKAFLRMAWLANPFAYIAINTLIAVMPGVAKRLDLSTMLAGFCCSVWCFARLAAFFVLWHWTGWHYRFRWLLVAYLALVGHLRGHSAGAEPGGAGRWRRSSLGCALGLIYYSSLFYSMDVGDTKGEHGGIHEAAIGLGNLRRAGGRRRIAAFPPAIRQQRRLAVSGLLLAAWAACWRSGAGRKPERACRGRGCVRVWFRLALRDRNESPTRIR